MRPRPLRVFAGVWLAATLLMVLWSMATPNSASPDEPAHLVKAASVVRGEFLGPETNRGMIVHVPAYVAWTHAQTCFAFDDDATADCPPPLEGDSDRIVETHTSAGLYNPVYYLTVGWPTLIFDDVAGIFAMRIVSAVLTSLFLAAAAGLVAAWRRPALPLLSLAVVGTPMLLFLGGSVNPNAMEVTTVLAVTAGMLTLILERDRLPFRVPAMIVLVAGALAVNMRGFSPLWVLLAIALPLLLLPRRAAIELLTRRWTVAAAVVILGATTFAGIWLLSTGTLTASTEEGDAQVLYPGAGQPFAAGFLWIVERTFSLGSEMVGLFGWMDTAAPAFAQLVWGSLIAVLLTTAVVALRGRPLTVVLLQAAALVFAPAIIQGVYVTSGGYIWQGRYALPLLVSLLLTVGALLSHRVRTDSSPFTRIVVLVSGAIAFAHLWAFLQTLRRYAVGVLGSWPQMLRIPDWEPPGGVLLHCALALLGFAGAAVLSARVVLTASTLDSPLPPGKPPEVHHDPEQRSDAERERDSA